MNLVGKHWAYRSVRRIVCSFSKPRKKTDEAFTHVFQVSGAKAGDTIIVSSTDGTEIKEFPAQPDKHGHTTISVRTTSEKSYAIQIKREWTDGVALSKKTKLPKVRTK